MVEAHCWRPLSGALHAALHLRNDARQSRSRASTTAMPKMANEHYQNLMRRSFVEARRVLKPGAPLVCVYAHRTTEGWATLIRALVDAGLISHGSLADTNRSLAAARTRLNRCGTLRTAFSSWHGDERRQFPDSTRRMWSRSFTVSLASAW